MRRVKHLMTREVFTVAPDVSVADLLGMLEHAGGGAIPVVDCRHTLEGVVSARDVLRLTRNLPEGPDAARWGLALTGLAAEHPDPGAVAPAGLSAYYVTPSGKYVDIGDRVRQIPGDRLRSYTVRDIMSGLPAVVGPDASLPELSRILRKQRLHRLFVVDSGALVGVVSTMDLLDGLWGAVPAGASRASQSLPPVAGCAERM